jgi:hypothetical protein
MIGPYGPGQLTFLTTIRGLVGRASTPARDVGPDRAHTRQNVPGTSLTLSEEHGS